MFKKIFIGLFISVPLLITGCTNNNIVQDDYKSVSEYIKAMTEVQNSIPGYRIEGTKYTPKGNYKFVSYIKGRNWKDIVTVKDRKIETVSNKNGTFAHLPNGYKRVNIRYSISSWLYFWNKSLDNNFDQKLVFVNNKSVKSNIKCRNLSFIDDDNKDSIIDACISDKYGIAVYLKINKSKDPTLINQYIKVNKIDIIDIPDSTFDIK